MRNPLKVLREIKSVAFASVENGEPQIRIIDVMLVEEDKLYFLTARGKAFYKQIKELPQVAIVGMTSEYLTIRLKGKVKQIEREWVDKMFDANPMMNDLYPGEKRDILEAFCLYEGEGEVFDLSITPPKRAAFTVGNGAKNSGAYVITKKCIACGECFHGCPVNAILEGNPYVIKQELCLHCGRCYELCPNNAINYRV